MYRQVFCILFIVSSVSTEQSFNIEPQDTTVIEGATATLICLINNLQGDIYWLKGGEILGSTANRDLTTYPRYRITAETSGGNLEITNAQIEDDDDYTCQVSPVADNPQLISDSAHLTVQVAPDDPVITSYSNGSKVTVRPPGSVSLTCEANNAQPEATITWLEDGDPTVAQPIIVISNAGDPNNKKKNVASTITIQPTKAQNGVVFKCIVEHPALQGYTTFTTVILDVQSAPQQPFVTGYDPSTPLKSGQSATFTCSSYGGNPQPDVFWYKNGEIFDSSYTTVANNAQNELVYDVGYGDHNVELECRVSSIFLETPYTTTITLTVFYGSAYVNVTGHESLVKEGDSVLLTCTSAPSNPASHLSWISQGAIVDGDVDVIKEVVGSGFITSKNLTIPSVANRETVQYMCQATNDRTFEQAQTTVAVNVMYKPDPPFISGYKGAKVRAGSVMSLTCVSVGGNPLANLQWYKGDQELEGVYEKSSHLANSKLTWILSQEDNQVTYSCNATNTATDIPLHASQKLNVLFPPSTVHVTLPAEKLKEGDDVIIKCKTASSNPVSVITWYKDGTEIEGMDLGNISSANGGYSTRNKVILRKISPDDNGKIFKCSALNELLTESVNDAITLDVQYAPKMTVETGTTIRKSELTGPVRLECGAHGNPSDVTLKWMKNDVDIVLPNSKYEMEESGAFVIHNATRSDSGVYKCLATNEIGTGNITVTLNIEYSPAITTGNQIIVNLGTRGELRCQADANPKPNAYIKWSREGYNTTSFTQKYVNDVAILNIPSVSKEHGGYYKCFADNGIGSPASKEVLIIVQYKPQIDTAGNGKVATSTGQTALLKCRAEGAPEVKFKWQRFGKLVNSSSNRYTMEVRRVTSASDLYETRLVINQVDEVQDFGTYTCVAYNNIGESTFNIVVEKTSVPEAPTDLKVLSVSHDSVKLSWLPGFNGGLTQSYQIRFRREDLTSFQLMDVVPPSSTTFTVTGLNSNVKYDFNVRGRNELGSGPFMLHAVEANTSVEPTQAPGLQKLGTSGVSLWIVLLVAFCGFLFCFFINGFLCCCLVKRRRGNKLGKSSPGPIKKEDFELAKSQSSENPYQNGTISSYDRDSSKESDYDPYYYGDQRSYDERRRDRDYSDGATYSEEDRYSDNRQISPTPTDFSEYNGGLYNTGYRAPPERPPSYSSFDSYGGGRGGLTGSIVTESQLSEIEEQEEKDYADLLRMKQSQVQKTLSGQVRQVSTPTPPPVQMGNFVPLTKAHPLTSNSRREAISEEGFLV
ncbi:nephrin-like [Antedon mediterranea]|uniref:nephrin-like n=1 Tax=Antedon mediterranea TaxID=105859 RepID=UPI003AF53564